MGVPDAARGTIPGHVDTCIATTRKQTMPHSEQTQIEHNDGASVIHLRGRVNHEHAEQIREDIMAHLELARPAAIVFDMGEVEYMSSAGLRILMLVSRAAKQSATRIAFCSLRPTMLEIFKISRFDKVFACHETLEQALVAARAR